MKKILSSPLAIVFAIIIFLLSSYWIVTNVKLEDLIGQANVQEVSEIKDNSNVPAKETATVGGGGSYDIRDNNIVEVVSKDNFKVIVRGEDLEGMESLSGLMVSPDKQKLCFLVNTIVPIWLYVYDFGSGDLSKVDVAKNCFWSPDSRYIAYNNHTTDVSDISVLIYDTDKKVIKDYMKGMTPEGWFMQCSFVDWISSNEMKVSCLRISDTSVSLQDSMGDYFINVLSGNVRHYDLPD